MTKTTHPIEEYYKESYFYLYNFALSICKSKEMAEDLVGESLLKILLMDKQIVGGMDGFRSICTTVIKNTYIGVYRKKQNQEKYKHDFILQRIKKTRNDFNEADKIKEVLNTLSPKSKAVLEARIEGFKLRDIVELLDMNMSTVKGHILRARKSLQPKLQEFI